MFVVDCVCSLKYLLNIYYRIFKSKLFVTFTRVCLDLFEIFLLLANFVEEVDFQDCFAILLLSSLINFNNVDLFEDDLEDKIDKKL
jgi:hypothetical protein